MPRNTPKKAIRQVLNSNDKADCKSVKYTVRLTSKVRNKLKEVWRFRTYPDPKDNTKSLHFNSEADYVDFLLRATNDISQEGWYWFKHIHNPFYKEKVN